jgi:hypothetical protein
MGYVDFLESSSGIGNVGDTGIENSLLTVN